MKITVEHEVSPESASCSYGGDFFGKDVCQYYACRNRTHGRKAPIERNVPKCTLFNTWLERPFAKCTACVTACQGAEKTERTAPNDF